MTTTAVLAYRVSPTASKLHTIATCQAGAEPHVVSPVAARTLSTCKRCSTYAHQPATPDAIVRAAAVYATHPRGLALVGEPAEAAMEKHERRLAAEAAAVPAAMEKHAQRMAAAARPA